MKKHQTFHPSMGPSPFRLMGSLAILFCLITSSSATLPLTDSGGAFAQTKGFSITPPINTVYFGMQVNAAGDLNNDGIDDIVIGARNSLNFSFNPAFVLFGRLDGFSEDIDLMTTDLATTKQGFRITSSTDWQWFAVTQANGGDVNGDGIADILFGAGSGTKFNAMCIVILGGKDRNSDINLETTNLVASGQGFAIGANIPGNSGGSVSTTGDINNDGINDILIVNHGTNAAGYVWFGRKGEPANVDLVDLDLDTSQQGFQITLTAGASSQFGHASGCVGDLNHDGIDDFAIGAHGSGAVGVVYVFFGKEGVFSDINLDSTSLAGTGQGFKVIGATTTGQVGWSISTAIPLDYNNDGIDDLFFGAPGENAVYVVFGKTTGFTDINLATTSLSANKLGFKITGASGDQLGSSVSPVGDVNGDLIEDILIGSSKSGMTYVVYGREGDPEDIDLTKISLSATSKGYAVTKDGVKTGFSFGGAVSYAGDLNRDGVNDLIIGAPQTTPVFSASYPGKVYTTITSAELIIAQVVKVATTIYEIIAVVSCSICVNSSFVITFGVMSKLVQVIRYLDLPYPYQLLEVLRNSNGELMNLNLPADVENQLEMKQIEAIFGETSVANSFLSNTWGMLIVLASLLGSWMLCKLTYYLLQRVKRLKGHFILSIIKVLCKTSLSFFIIQLYENLGEITFYSVIEFKSVTFSTPLSNFSFVLSIIFIFLGLTILILHGRFLYRYKSVRLQHKDSSKEIEEFVAKNDYLRLLYDEFVDTAIHKQAYPFILALLDILIFFTVSLLVPYPLLESIILLCCALFLCVYLIWRRPYKERFDQFTQIFLEFCVLIVFGCVVIFAATCGSVKAARNNKYDAQRLALGVIYMIIIIKVSSSLFMGIKIIEQIRGGYKAYSQRKRSKIQAAPSINILKKIPIKSMDDKGELSDSSLTINSFSPPGKASSRILSKNLSNQLYVKPSLDHESSLNTTQNTPHPDTTRGALLVNFKEKMAVGSESTLLSRFSSEKSKLLQKSKENPSDTPTSSIIMAQEQGPSTTKPQTIQRLEFGSKRSYQGLGEKAPAITLKSNSNVTTQHKLAKGK